MSYARGTIVSPDRSKAEIETLRRLLLASLVVCGVATAFVPVAHALRVGVAALIVAGGLWVVSACLYRVSIEAERWGVVWRRGAGVNRRRG